ncbi:MAG: aminoacetone oxidase family FAD-binding enzyme, partial [Proteobacteria bacterium]
PVYTYGIPGPAELDLKPDLGVQEIIQKLERVKENLSPLRRAKKVLNLCPASLALLFHYGAKDGQKTISSFAQQLKHFPLNLIAPRPLEESISSSGGISWDEIDLNMMLTKLPGVFAAGEMLDWDAPTGGYLIQASVSQGFFVGKKTLTYVHAR